MNLAGLRRRCLNRMGVPMFDSFYPDHVVNDAVNQALATIQEEQNWPWDEATATLTVPANTGKVALPSDWRAVKAVYYQGYELVEQSITDYMLGNVPPNGGAPGAYTVSANDLLVRPIPGSAVDVLVVYYRAEPELVNDTDEPLLPDRYESAVVAKAAELLSARQDDARARAAHLADYLAWINRMRRTTRSTTRPTVPRVRPGSWYELT